MMCSVQSTAEKHRSAQTLILVYACPFAAKKIPAVPQRDAPIHWFRHIAPYINEHRGKTFVLYLGSDAITSEQLVGLIHDIALLQTLGVRLVLVHGAREAIDAALERDGYLSSFHRGDRITTSGLLGVVRDSIAALRLKLERLLSMGLPNTPMRGARLRVVSGNFVTAKPRGG